jgi:glyoxylase-like metal-dependent hydrolase (beta-lactamase superfamily II)/rhodanese-related sulfurtransferase
VSRDAALEIVPVVDEGLGNSSYLVGLGDGRALVLDPSRDPSTYLAEAECRGWSIAFSAETHLHADFISGSRELAALGAEVVAPAEAGLEFPARGLGDGDEVDLGGLTMRALATPGHTPEHLAYLLLDGSRPAALFSGGSLLVGAVARTDLISPDETEDLARSLWRSIHDRILTLPDDLGVYPTHGSGSFCSAPSGGERTTTVGRERASNPLLAVPDEDAFVKLLLERLGSYPPYFLRLRERNRRGPRVYGTPQPALASLAVDAVQRMRDEGAEIVDVRPVEAFAAAHIRGSLSIQLRPQFASWLGWLLDDDVPLIFIREPNQDASGLVRQALGIGYERLAGELEGGIEGWRAAGLPLTQTQVADAASVTGRVLDVRQDSEFAAGHLPSALHIELGSVADAATELPPGPLATMCGHGERAASAASVLERSGREDVTVVLRGPEQWASVDGPLATEG